MNAANDLAAQIAQLPTPIIPADRAMMTCPKCAGSRKFVARSPYNGRTTFVGKCFECNATGAVPRARAEKSKAASDRTGLALYSVSSIVMLAVSRGNEDRAEFYLQRVVREHLFYIGEQNARKVLDAIGSGRWTDDYDGTHGEVDADVAAKWRARAIEIGRELCAGSAEVTN